MLQVNREASGSDNNPGPVYEPMSIASLHHSPIIPSNGSQFLMADRSYESGRARSSHTDSSRSRRSPTAPPSNVYYSSSSHPGRPTLPPIPTSNPTPRGMPASSNYPTTTYRSQSPGRYDDAPSFSSHYHSTSNTQSGAASWSQERQVESRGVPSQPTGWSAYPTQQTQYDPRYVGQQQSYYQQTQMSAAEAQRRLPPLNISGVPGQDDSHYLPNQSAGRSQISNPYSPQSPYSVDSSRSSRYSPPHYSSSTQATAGSSRHHSSSYAHAGSATVPFTSPEWNGPLASGSSRHDDPIYGSTSYNYPQQGDRDWSDIHSPTDSRSDEPLIKKKRKRADANQLRVLNATYQRTAFPSTQERESLAKELDMSPRSVQIWFQNKRQSMRQSRNAANNLPPILHSAYSHPSPSEPKPTHQTYHTLSAEASSSRRREGTPSESRRRSG